MTNRRLSLRLVLARPDGILGGRKRIAWKASIVDRLSVAIPMLDVARPVPFDRAIAGVRVAARRSAAVGCEELSRVAVAGIRPI